MPVLKAERCTILVVRFLIWVQLHPDHCVAYRNANEGRPHPNEEAGGWWGLSSRDLLLPLDDIDIALQAQETWVKCGMRPGCSDSRWVKRDARRKCEIWVLRGELEDARKLPEMRRLFMESKAEEAHMLEEQKLTGDLARGQSGQSRHDGHRRVVDEEEEG